MSAFAPVESPRLAGAEFAEPPFPVVGEFGTTLVDVPVDVSRNMPGDVPGDVPVDLPVDVPVDVPVSVPVDDCVAPVDVAVFPNVTGLSRASFTYSYTTVLPSRLGFK
jgi:hypothetical protein